MASKETPSPPPPGGFSEDRSHEQKVTLWSTSNETKKCQKYIADVLEERGYSLDTVIGGSKVSTVWLGKFQATIRKGPVPYHIAQLASSGKTARFDGDESAKRKAAKDAEAETMTPASVPVAIKVSTGLTPTTRRFLQREMRIWKELEHPNVVTVFEVLDMTQGCCITMEATENGDLLDHIQRNGFIPEAEAKRIFIQVISAVDFLHERDIAHRDLKCENVLMFGDGRFKLTDFGFARSCRDPTNGTKVLSETFCGSLPYVAPEVLEGTTYNPKYSDVWSLGVMLYVILYGCLPLPDENVLELLHKAKDQDFFFPEEVDVSNRAIDLMLAMMEPDVLARASLSNVQRSPWVTRDDEDSSDSSLSPPSIIIQGKGAHRDSFLSDLTADEGDAGDFSTKEDGVCNSWESEATGKRDSAKTTIKKIQGESGGDATPDWKSFEWSRDRQPSNSNSTSSNESAIQQP